MKYSYTSMYTEYNYTYMSTIFIKEYEFDYICEYETLGILNEGILL